MMSMPLGEQQSAKIARVIECFKSVGLSIEKPSLESSSERYRNRFRARVIGGHPRFVFEHAQDCFIASESLVNAIESVKEAFQDLAHATSVSHLEVRATDDNMRAGLFLHLHSNDRRALESLRVRLPHFLVSSDYCENIERQTFEGVRVPLNAFAQVNTQINRALVKRVCELAQKIEANTFVEYFCGSGNFSLALARKGLRGDAYDNNAQALDACRESIQRLDIEALTLHCVDASAFALHDVALVVANPPRAGLQKAREFIIESAAPHIVLVCCGLESIAKDCAALVHSGYRIRNVECFDMFAHTKWVETLVLLER